MTNVYQSLFFILRFLLIFLSFFMPKGFDYFKLLGKCLHQRAVFGRFFGDRWQDVLVIGIGEHSAQYALPDEALVIAVILVVLANNRVDVPLIPSKASKNRCKG